MKRAIENPRFKIVDQLWIMDNQKQCCILVAADSKIARSTCALLNTNEWFAPMFELESVK